MAFYPRSQFDTIYVAQSLVGAEQIAQLTTIHTVDFEISHRRLAHPSPEVMRKAMKHLKNCPRVDVPKEHICPGCAKGKMTNKTFPPTGTRATKPFEMIHADLKEFPIESYQKYKYSLVLYDDCTSHAWTVNMRTKDAALPAVRHFLIMVETKYQTKVQKWRSDSGGEFKSNAFTLMLKERGIEVVLSVPHAHQQNGRAERIIRTIMDKSETMRMQACLPASWWQFSFDHATHVYNRTPNRRLNWQTPYQKLTGEVPSVEHLRVLGCAAYVFIPAEVRTNKMAPKSELMVYLGNQPGGKGWIFMRGPNNIVFTAAQATFDETMFPRCPAADKRQHTRLQTPAPSPSSCRKDGTCQCPHSGKEKAVVDDEPLNPTKPTPKTNSKGKGKATEPPAPLPPHRSKTPVTESEQEDEPEPAPRREPSPPTQRPTRERKVPKRPGNVYGDEHPVDILRKTRRTRDWKEVVGEKSSRPVKGQEREPVPGPSTPPPPPER
jgi:transposase InsO family protein